MLAELSPREMQAIVQSHNDKVGFSEFSLVNQLEKLDEETKEVITASLDVNYSGWNPENSLHLKQEIGDVLWVLLDIANRHGIDIQTAFAETGTKNMTRYNEHKRRAIEEEGFYGMEAYREIKRREDAAKPRL